MKNRGKIFTALAIGAIIVAIVIVVVAVMRLSGNNDNDVSIEMTDNGVRVSSGSDNAADVEVFEDYSCIHCAHMETDAGTAANDAVSDGSVNVEYRFMTFLDNGEVGHSTNALAATVALVENSPEHFEEFHYKMFRDRDEVMNWNRDNFVEYFNDIDANSAAGALQTKAPYEKAYTIASNNTEEMEDRIGTIGTPMVYVDGEIVELPQLDNGDVGSWLRVI